MAQPKILVAEDERVFAFDLCETVEEAGFRVTGPFSDSNSAITACKKGKPDLAILDVDLDGGNVYPLAQQLMDDDIPVIFHSGNRAKEELKRRFPNARTMRKPCPPSVMLSKVSKALSTH